MSSRPDASIGGDKPRLAYAANRGIGLACLRDLIEIDWRPCVLILPSGPVAESVEEMKGLVPEIPVLEQASPLGTEEMLRVLDVDYLLSVHFPFKFPRAVLEAPAIGILNLHPAWLPYNRGWHTPTWAIYEKTPYGATLHWVDEGLDSGDIALRRPIEVQPDDTAHTLYQRVLELEETLLREALPLMIEKRLPRIPQERHGTSHAKHDIVGIQMLELGRVARVEDVIKQLRALTTNRRDEAAYFEVDGMRYRMRVEIVPEGPMHGA